MTEQSLMAISQFGAAGLIGMLWILERRQAMQRERQLDETHRRIMEEERDNRLLMDIVRENTRAISCLERSQREMTRLLRAIAARRRPARSTASETAGYSKAE
ncbi:MAG: hypothetical protein ACR2GY_12170 [Phycisphaerales bacterium]